MIKTSILDDFIDYLKTAKGLSEKTCREYYYDIRTFMRFIYKRKIDPTIEDEDIDIDEVDEEVLKSITKRDFYAYMGHLANGMNNSAKTRYRKNSSVRTFFKYLKDVLEIIDENPALDIEMPKIDKSLPIYLTLDECMSLLTAVRNYKQKKVYEMRDYAIITLFLNTGMRLSELVGINIKDIRNDDTLRVIGKGNKERTIYLNDACRSAIDDYLKLRPQVETDALFLSSHENRISNRAVQKLVEKHLNNAGLDSDRYSVHKLRHTAATLMYQYGNADILALKEILGHESVATTQIYTHINSDVLKSAVENNPLSEVKINKKK